MRRSRFGTLTFLATVTSMVMVAAACGAPAAQAPTAAPAKPAATTAPAAPAATKPAATTAPAATKPAASPAAATTPMAGATPATKPAASPAAAAPPALTKEYRMSMATGGTAGTYFPYGGAIASLWSSNIPGVSVTAETTGASVENMRLLSSGQVELAMVQNDIADYAFNSTEMFKERVTNFRAVANLYPELLQWVVDPSIQNVSDLRGKRFVVGAAGSGTEANTRQVLEANGITYQDLGRAAFLSFAEAGNAFKDRQVDGFAVTGGVPTSAITDVATTRDIALLPITGEAARNVTGRYQFYVEASIPANAYRGVASEVTTVAVQSILVAREDLDPDLVYWLTKTLIEKQPDLAQAHAKGRELSRESAVKGITVPWHPGAERYYREAGILR